MKGGNDTLIWEAIEIFFYIWGNFKNCWIYLIKLYDYYEMYTIKKFGFFCNFSSVPTPELSNHILIPVLKNR